MLPRQFRRRARRPEPAGRGQLAQGLGDRGRLSRVHHGNADHAGLGQGPDRRRSAPSSTRSAAPKANWKTDLSGGIQRVAIKHGCAPFGNAKARCVVWNFPDPVPFHREPLYTPRRDLVAQYPTWADRSSTACRCSTSRSRTRTSPQTFPIILTSGRLVEYEGGGDETRSNPWLAELQQNMFVEINPHDANNAGIRDGGQVWVYGPEGGKVKVMAHGHRAGRQGRGLHAVPLRRLVPGPGPARASTPKVPTRSCSANRPTPRRPTATTR